MEVKIGITDVPREVTIDTTVPADEIADRVRDAVANASLFELVDEKGRRVLIPGARIAYLDLGSPTTRTVGFGAV
ncbi:ATP-binding protein [Tessaracoccus lapidicaptus]|jgi:hypothetical protein|uniref:ATP-binding protein n=1 Tax=Tessaracoccus lapidicaptus TaxID=1427523 RepID=A0A1C0AKC5_9ACTN|nr:MULTISPECIES: DUF3107 domain-containing protein [Tessaracoccus]AQX14534.1 ATP-binding protein [Tessaracoccus sp. T2.5-30]OCL32953.1 ATP-binding protein [Tessaracoccus lapidicaptus]VEP38551.1 hypothetical protein TLA_TLA_00042 [Tessaracoccus lapidicaptus]